LCFATSRDVTEALIAVGARIDFKDNRSSTPLHSIAAYRHTLVPQGNPAQNIIEFLEKKHTQNNQ